MTDIAQYDKGNSLKRHPHSIQAEQAVIACILIDASVIDKAISSISYNDFYHPSHSLIYSTIERMYAEGKLIDITSLLTRLTDDNNLDKVGGGALIASLLEILPNSANLDHYIEIISDKSMLRKVIKIMSEISEQCYNYTGDIVDLIDNVESRIFQASTSKMRTEVSHISGMLDLTLKNIEKLYDKKDKDSHSGLPSGFIDLDKYTNGFQASDLIIVAGRPGMGKTAFALSLILNATQSDNANVVLFSLEMSGQQLVQRLLSSESGIGMSKLRSGRYGQEEWSKLVGCTNILSDLNLYIDDTPAISATELRAKCRRLKKEKKLDLIVIDYLQLMGSKNAESREQQISEISRSLKALAKELDIPVIALAQLNRDVEKRPKDKRPLPSDLRESGAIEQDADIIMFLYRDDVYNKDTTSEPGVAEVIIAKHRNGPTGTVKLRFLQESTRFENLSKDNYYG